MEEMSKKTKRLEKENLNLTRKQEATNKNIFQMAEERSQSQQTIDRLARENEKLKKLCRAMQSGGYGMAGGMAGPHDPNAEFDEGLDGETESEYEDEEYDEDEEGEYEEDTEEEGLDVQQQHAQQQQQQQQQLQHQQGKMFGPAPPPPPPVAQQQALPNGKASLPQQLNGSVNGTGH
jgi:hypothetical protein